MLKMYARAFRRHGLSALRPRKCLVPARASTSHRRNSQLAASEVSASTSTLEAAATTATSDLSSKITFPSSQEMIFAKLLGFV